jgi:hypothetical protein
LGSSRFMSNLRHCYLTLRKGIVALRKVTSSELGGMPRTGGFTAHQRPVPFSPIVEATRANYSHIVNDHLKVGKGNICHIFHRDIVKNFTMSGGRVCEINHKRLFCPLTDYKDYAIINL